MGSKTETVLFATDAIGHERKISAAPRFFILENEIKVVLYKVYLLLVVYANILRL